jgi:hypothetical protein
MVEVLFSLLRLLGRAAELTFEYMGVTKTSGVIGLLSVVLPLFYILYYEGLEGLKNHLKNHWKGSVLFVFVLAVASWVVVFMFCMAKAIYDDHWQLIAAISRKQETIERQGKVIKESEQTIGEQKKVIEGLQAKLKEQSKTTDGQTQAAKKNAPFLQLVSIKFAQTGQEKRIAAEIKNVGSAEADAILILTIGMRKELIQTPQFRVILGPSVSRFVTLPINEENYKAISTGQIQLEAFVSAVYEPYRYSVRMAYDPKTGHFNMVKEQRK